MTVLLSIKPEFAYKIFDGSKKFEYRKTMFKRNDVRKVIVYASSPVQKVIGEFMVDDIINDEINSLWNKTAPFSEFTKEFFLSYFDRKDKAYAIKVGKTFRYVTPKQLSDYNIRVAPQSFVYIREK